MSLTFAHLPRVLPVCFPVALSLLKTRMSRDLAWELPGKTILQSESAQEEFRHWTVNPDVDAAWEGDMRRRPLLRKPRTQ